MQHVRGLGFRASSELPQCSVSAVGREGVARVHHAIHDHAVAWERVQKLAVY